MIVSLLSAGSKLLSPSKRKKSGKDMVGSIMNKEQKALPAGKPKRVTSSAIIPKRTVIPTTQLLEPPKESNSVDGIRTKIETLISMFGSKFSARKKIDKNKNQTDDLQKRKEKEDRIEATRSLKANAFPKKKIPGEGALDGLKRFFTFTLIGFIVNNIQKIIEAIQGFIERLKPIFKVLGEFLNKLKDSFNFFRESYEENKPKIVKAIDYAKEKYEEFKENFEKFKDQFSEFIDATGGFAQKIIDFVQGKIDVEGKPTSTANTQRSNEPITASSLFQRISGGEGGIDSYNTGIADNQEGYTPPKPISQMTVDEVVSLQEQKSVFAVGKFQITPIAMPAFIKYLTDKGVDTATRLFDENLQDMYSDYVLTSKRAKVGKFIKGDSSITLEKALIELSAEFASIGVPRDMKKGEYSTYSSNLGGPVPKYDIKKGMSLYDGYGGNRSQPGLMEDVKSLLLEKRKSTIQEVASYTGYAPSGGVRREIYLQETVILPTSLA